MEENYMKKDEYGLFIDAPNYHQVRQEMEAHYNYYHSPRAQLKKIPKWVRWIFNAKLNQN